MGSLGMVQPERVGVEGMSKESVGEPQPSPALPLASRPPPPHPPQQPIPPPTPPQANHNHHSPTTPPGAPAIPPTPTPPLIKNDHDFGTPNTDSQFLNGSQGVSALNSYLGNPTAAQPALKRLRLASATSAAAASSAAGGAGAGNRVLLLNSSINGRPSPPSSFIQRRPYVPVDGDGLVTTTPSVSYSPASSAPSYPARIRPPHPSLQPQPRLHSYSASPHPLTPTHYYQYRPTPQPKPKKPSKPKKPRAKKPPAQSTTQPEPPQPRAETSAAASSASASSSAASAVPAPTAAVPPPPAFLPRPPPIDDTPIRQKRLEGRCLSLNERLGQLLLLGGSQHEAVSQLQRLSAEAGAYLSLPDEDAATATTSGAASSSAASTAASAAAKTTSPATAHHLPPPSTAPSARSKGPRNAARDALLERKLSALMEGSEMGALSLKREELLAKTPSELARWIKRYDLRRIHELVPTAAAHAFTLGRGLLSLPAEDVKSVAATAPALATHLGQLSAAYDSDATDDSDLDEGPVVASARAPRHSSHLPSRRREVGWAGERSWLGSRWGWVESEMGDLEYRIRQAVDLTRQLRAIKEPVRLAESEGGCARTSPLASALPRRRLLRVAGLHAWKGRLGSGAAAECGCAPPLPPCLLCTARPSPSKAFAHLPARLAPPSLAPARRAPHSPAVKPLSAAIASHLKAQGDGFKAPLRKRTVASTAHSLRLVQPSPAAAPLQLQAPPLSIPTPPTSAQASPLPTSSLPHSPLKLKIKLNGLSASQPEPARKE